jgi:predicted nucleic acid-binding protein
MPASFIDSNVLIYLASANSEKADRAEQVLAAGGHVSVQVLNEVTSVVRRKLRMSWPRTHEFLSLIKRLTTIHPLTLETHAAGLALAERYGLSIYDAQLVSCALQAECTVLWSEDMQHALSVEGRLTILSPFRDQD